MTGGAEGDASHILFERRGRLGRVVLNRPKALNALTADMCAALFTQLQTWRDDAEVTAVTICGAGDKAFCAGGDVIRLYDDGRTGGHYPQRFYWQEYRCNALIKCYPKPFIAFMDGIVMGGGVGVSVHGSHRVMTERTVFAMPETGIGLFPDVGGTYFLPRLPGRCGIYLGLTGRRLKAADGLALGLGTAFVPAGSIGALEDRLAAEATTDPAAITTIIADFAGLPDGGMTVDERAAIDLHFGHDSIEAIVASLEAAPGDWAKKARAELAAKAPLSLKVTMRQLSRGGALSFADAMRLEWRLASRFTAGHDFYEGVRALLVDRDMAPRWRPATLDAVTSEMVDAYFAPLGGDELDLRDIVRESER